MKRRKPARPRSLGLDLLFEQAVRQVPPATQPRLLAWLRRWRRRPGREFWEVTPRGEWRRL